MTVLTPRSETRGSALRTLWLVVGVAAAYYVGGLLGLSLRLPGTTPSVFWPPNALLTAALLLSPPRLWPICIGAALVPHVAAQLAAGWSFSFTLAIFTTNCLEALLAAAGIRYLSDAPDRFDSLRRLSIFLAVCVIAAPLVSTFADAAIVYWLHNEPYWQVWRARLASNLLAQLAITPAAITLVRGLPEWLHRAPRWRQLEAAALGISLGVSLGLALWLPLGGHPSGESVKLVVARMPLLLSLPFLLWAAMRFHTAGASLAFLVVALGTARAAVHEQWFGAVPISDSTILAVQLVLVIVGVTLLIVGTVIAERDRTARDLADNLWFHALLSQLSATFVQMPGERLESTLDVWLESLGRALRLDQVRVVRFTEHDQRPTIVSTWFANTDLPPPSNVKEDFPWMVAELLAGRPVIVEDARRLPDEASIDRAGLIALEMEAVLILPLVAEQQVLGTVGFGCRVPRAWPDSIVAALRLVSDVFASALLRQRTEEALTASEAMKSAIVASLPTGVAVIDRAGAVRAVNDNWTHLMRESEDPAYPAVHVGDNLVESFRLAARYNPRLMEAVGGVSAVMSGARDRFAFEHARFSDGATRWWTMHVAPLRSFEPGGAVVTYAEITEHRRAEQEAERGRQELAHVTRVSTMGALAVSLAHQLNQPLAAIMANAQAGIRLLENHTTGAGADTGAGDLRAILADVVDDDKRASDVIRRLRDLLKNGRPADECFDLGASIQDIASLVKSDAVIRNVTVTLELARASAFVRGDRVQLQQVVLNLLVNALEASDAASGGGGRVEVECRCRNDGVAEVTVRDSGRGLDPSLEEQVFEPFYTTKPGGMGMGLSIARSIVEAHGGRIRIGNASVQGGAIAEFTLPLDRSEQHP
jgi:signal transduction histidine kinase/integral membrane sensor domain MASE1